VNGTMNDTATARTTPHPRDFRLTVPDGWIHIVLDPGLWPRQIAAVVDRQFKGIDNLPVLRRELRDQLTAQAESAHANGGIALYLSLLQVDGFPLAAGMIVSVIPPQEDGTAVPLEQYALAMAASGKSIRMTDTQAGPALLHRYLSAPDPETAMGSTLSTVHLDVQLAVPNTGSQLLLSFSSPVAPLAEMMVELFETVANTLQWVG